MAIKGYTAYTRPIRIVRTADDSAHLKQGIVEGLAQAYLMILVANYIPNGVAQQLLDDINARIDKVKHNG